MRRVMEKIDFKRLFKGLYTAKGKVEEVHAGKAAFLAVDGIGAPGGSVFQEGIGRLFGAAYTLKYMLKGEGLLDFAVPPLECLWYDDPAKKPMSQWSWRVLIRIPDAVTARDLDRVKKALAEKKGINASSVKRLTWSEGHSIQILHVGPYDQVGTSYAQLGRAAEERGFVCVAPGHEIYLNDPRRVAQERLKTIVRMSVKKMK